jgi:hypothetical protein
MAFRPQHSLSRNLPKPMRQTRYCALYHRKTWATAQQRDITVERHWNAASFLPHGW